MEQTSQPIPSINIQDATRRLLEDIRNICEQFHIVSLDRQIEACEGLLTENPPIDVAVLGQFKAGKSSFLNSLIGKPILPVGVIPVTTVISRLMYGEREKTVVSFFDGTRAEVDLNHLDEYTSEAKNPSNQKNVEFVDIELPALKDFAGLRLVDTPGLGSVFKYHMETAEHWLPEVGAALLAVSSDRPLSENDLQLIRNLMQHTPKIVLLLTKVDLLSTEQQSEVILFFEKTLKRELNREFPIFLYSTRVNMEHFRDRLEAGLLFKLSVNRDFELRKILQYKIQSLVKGCLNYLDIALKTSLQADYDREGLKKQILDEKVNYDLVREELFVIGRENQRQTRILIMNHLNQLHMPLRRKTLDRLVEDMPSWKGNLWKLTRRFEVWVEETMTEEMRRISKAEHRHFYGTLKKANASFSRSLEAFRTLLGANIEKVLSVKLAEAEWKIEVSEPEHPDIKAVRPFDYYLDLIWFLIPMFIFRRFFEKNFMRKIPHEVEANLSRLAAQWEDRINRTIDEMRKQALQYAQDELTTIDALLSKTQGQSEEIRRLLLDLQEKSKSLMN